MKKLSKLDLLSLKNKLPVLDEWEQRSILGGTDDTAGIPYATPEPITGVVVPEPYAVETVPNCPMATSAAPAPTAVAPELTRDGVESDSLQNSCYSTGAIVGTGSVTEYVTSYLESPTVATTPTPVTGCMTDAPILIFVPALTSSDGLLSGWFEETYGDLMEIMGIEDYYEGVTIFSERYQYTDQSTMSRFYASSSDNCVELLSGYFMEPAWDITRSMLEGSDRAIHPGTYEVAPYSSERHQNRYQIQDVPGRSYILIHPGRIPDHTSGCLLPGCSTGEDQINDSRKKFDELNEFIKEYGDEGTRIIIENE